ncbi:DUF4097 family beta strand repeat-containing protein [Yinghuangia soli]|uniref:DUF4097 family beta strand repeat-containing protein n=1 Tax=Yinghuangia soli TaxID=2908204 RepID=A0AA41Q896_9ACTN|nr:DUF4097 family beta strand repeat-containing protein [Yinghuangia soli]MCF2533062.1 DUF4097 family beta strand repeat-containing protein [Yinghuangia soli]
MSASRPGNRRRRRLALLIPAAAVLPLALAACDLDVDVDADNKKSSSYDVAEKAAKISVSTTAGKVTVTEKDIQRVQVTETKHWEGDTEPTTTHNVNADTLDLGYKCAKNNACWVSYDITVPRGTATRVETDAGEVELRGLSGDLDVSTGAGKIDGTGLTAKQATARTTAGSLTLSFASAPAAVDAKTTAGRATVQVPSGQSYAVDVDASVGDTDVDVAKDANAPSKIKVRTTAGQARVLHS